MKKFFGSPMAGIATDALSGPFIVMEGADGSGRSTHIQLLKSALEKDGYAVVDIGLLNSELVANEFASAREGTLLGPLTRGLFYATDLADQMEKSIVPALLSGMVVLCDRYVYTLIVRDLARGAKLDWLRAVYGFALVPDAVVYLEVAPKTLARRVLARDGHMEYWESGMDMGLSRDRYLSFIRYQERIARAFDELDERFHFKKLDGERPVEVVQEELRAYVRPIVRSIAAG
ncbi:MAG: thymidylate kinase [Gemmatimonadetes bacterium]|nr:thymidylate kinase [Gemmatimonadota bacterium]